MRNYFKIIYTVAIALLCNTYTAYSQSEVFAGGEITFEALPSTAICGDPQPYRITYKYYRDCTPVPSPFPDEKEITVFSKSLQLIGTFTLDQFQDRNNPIENECLKNADICTIGRWYSNKNPILIPPGPDWTIFYGAFNAGVIEGTLAQSPENWNINPGQDFYIETTMNNLCDTVQTRPNLNGIPAPNIKIANTWKNKSAEWLTEDIVENFCNGKTYNYRIPIRDPDLTIYRKNLNGGLITDTIYDSLSFKLVASLKAKYRSVFYSPGYSITAPIPTSAAGRIDPVDVEDGEFTFTPVLPLGIDEFVAVFSIEVTEWRKRFYVETTCPGGGCGINPEDSTDILRSEYVKINRTNRQLRFVIGNNCDDNLPDFEGTIGGVNNYNPTEDAFEFDCAVTEMDFRMSEPMLCRDALADPKWLSMYRGKPGFPLDDNGIGIDEIVPLNCNSLGEFTRFRVYLYQPIGPGHYTLFPKPNKSTNGIFNRCGFELKEGIREIPVYVNTNYKYVFKDNDQVLKICYPGEDQTLDALIGQPRLRDAAYLFTWQYTNNPDFPIDSFYYNSRYKLDTIRDTISQNPKFPPDGFWTVGVGLDFSYNYNGKRYEAVCYDEDEIVVQFFETPLLEIPDYDLCIGEPWPLINLDSMTIKHQAQDYKWSYVDTYGTWSSTGGTSNSKFQNDTLETSSTAFGLGKVFEYSVFVQLPQCSRKDTFSVVKQKVEVDIRPGNDSIICPGYEYTLNNIESYLVPDSMSYVWTLDGQVQPSDTTGSIKITKRGMYKLEVTKLTENSSCWGADSVYINVADSLGIPEPVCTQVTFKDGDIEQTFFIPAVPGADEFQVRQVDRFGVRGKWTKPNLTVYDHVLIGKQLKMEVRAVNTEVPVNSPCRYGPIGIAEPCNAIVKHVNVFTPNGDGVNELLRFDLLEVFPGSPLKIFNRWGELIYETDNYENNWDGEDYSEGTYFYVLDVNDESQGILKGTFTILR